MLAQPTAPAAPPPKRRFAHYDTRPRDFDRGPQTIATVEAGISLACAVVRTALADLLTTHSRGMARRFLLEDFQASIWHEWLQLAGISIRPDQIEAAVTARMRKTRRRADAG